ncbi:MAG: hypothetical protein K0S37_2019 [Microbacterium sp.]|jgi:glycopeptide antibiotics resistance protein|nr:hypothetical protein [Microbacterium sp.]
MSRPLFRARPVVVALTCYSAATAAIAFWPTPVDRPAAGLLRRVLLRLHEAGVPPWFDYSFVEVSANVVMFVPLGFLIAALLPRNAAWVAVVVGLLASMTIEIGQWLLLPQRIPAASDVVANTMGSAIGALVLLALTLMRDVHRAGLASR